MGQCYSVYLKAKVKDNAEFVRLSVDYLKGANIRKDSFDGEDLTTPIGNIKFVMAAHQRGFTEEQHEDGMPVYRSDFDASYSWESVLAEWFHAVAPALEDGSAIEVYPDYGHWELHIEYGEITETVVEEDEYEEEEV